MTPIKFIYNVILNSLFPISKEEEAVLSLSPQEAWKTLPRAKNFSTKEACSIFSYKDERMRKLIWALKYKKSKQAALICGFALYQILKIYTDTAGPILVIPMPITKQRRRERGFNQCELLSDAIQLYRIESDQIHIVTDLLVRTRHKSRQTMKNRNERILSAHELFKVISNDQISKENLTLIIDDVITTGSTMHEAIEAMRKAGFIKAFGLSLAH